MSSPAAASATTRSPASLLLAKQLKGTSWFWYTWKSILVHLVPHNGLRVHCQLTDAELQKKPDEGFSAGLVDDNNIFEWQVMIIGPPDTL